VTTKKVATKKSPKVRRKPAAARKETQINVRVTADQKAVLAAASEKEGAGLSTWILMVALRAARELGVGD
jgi:uncharacterized protein (DUF1778 family)